MSRLELMNIMPILNILQILLNFLAPLSYYWLQRILPEINHEPTH